MQLFGHVVMKMLNENEQKNLMNKIAEILCDKDLNISFEECFQKSNKKICSNSKKCRLLEKTSDQIDYILSSKSENIFLTACAGSGKTEVVGIKAAYEISSWSDIPSGIAILTFTNAAKNEISNRVQEFPNCQSQFPHFIGTFSSFIHQYIAQPFGYLLFEDFMRHDDCSFRIVDANLIAHGESWLENYKYKFSPPKNPIYANQIYNDLNEYYILQQKSSKPVSVRNYYDSQEFQSWLCEKRKNYPDYCSYDYFRKNLLELKEKFHSDGFANFGDMNYIAYKIISEKSSIAKIVALKFKFIIVDECQDLSWTELQIIEKLRDAGSTIHLIGDLDQSIFGFKLADPKHIEKVTSVNEFKRLYLNDNFRSSNELVKFTNKLRMEATHVVGHEKSLPLSHPLVYLEYNKDEISLVVQEYIEILNKFDVSLNKSCIIAKQNTVVEELKGKMLNNKKHTVINAMHHARSIGFDNKKKALDLLGEKLSPLFGEKRTRRNYFCPDSIQSASKWRIFLWNVLSSLLDDEKISNFSQTYEAWYKNIRKKIAIIIELHYPILAGCDVIESRDFNEMVKNKFKTPPKTGSYKIEPLKIANPNSIDITTIHESKGKTYDSTLVVSSPDSRSELGHWKDDWLGSPGEGQRVGYVASTRAKYLLVWAVPKFKNDEKALLESYGFVNSLII